MSEGTDAKSDPAIVNARFNARVNARFNARVNARVNVADKYDFESAVAPVVAVLLIMAVILTTISLYYAIFIPNLKEQSEIEHLSGVEDTILLFSSDIDNALLSKSEGTIKRNLELGGGNVILSPLKSGGVLKVSNTPEEWAYRLYNSSTANPSNLVSESSFVNITYEAVGNYWMDNSYVWDYGYVFLKTPYSSVTPLQYTTIDAVAEDINKTGGIFKSMFDLNYVTGIGFEKNAQGNLTGNTYNTCPEITITTVTFEKGDNDYTSGSGHATLKMNSKLEYFTFNDTDVRIDINPDLAYSADDVLRKTVGQAFMNFNSQNFKNVVNLGYSGNPADPYYYMTFSDPVKITVKNLILTISV